MAGADVGEKTTSPRRRCTGQQDSTYCVGPYGQRRGLQSSGAETGISRPGRKRRRCEQGDQKVRANVQ